MKGENFAGSNTFILQFYKYGPNNVVFFFILKSQFSKDYIKIFFSHKLTFSFNLKVTCLQLNFRKEAFITYLQHAKPITEVAFTFNISSKLKLFI